MLLSDPSPGVPLGPGRPTSPWSPKYTQHTVSQPEAIVRGWRRNRKEERGIEEEESLKRRREKEKQAKSGQRDGKSDFQRCEDTWTSSSYGFNPGLLTGVCLFFFLQAPNHQRTCTLIAERESRAPYPRTRVLFSVSRGKRKHTPPHG